MDFCHLSLPIVSVSTMGIGNFQILIGVGSQKDKMYRKLTKMTSLIIAVIGHKKIKASTFQKMT